MTTKQTDQAMTTKEQTGHTVGQTPWHANGRALMIHDKDNNALAAVVVNGKQLQIRDQIVLAVNAHADLVAACEGLLGMLADWDDNGDGLSGFEGFKQVAFARAALKRAKP